MGTALGRKECPMRKSMLVTVLTLGVLGLPLVSSTAAQVPTQDSVVLTGGPASAGPFAELDLGATSGPSGEDASGQVRFIVTVGPFTVGGPVTCLAVNGKTAILNLQDQISGL